MNAKERFTSWQKDIQSEIKATPEPVEAEESQVEPEVAPEQSSAEKVFAEVVDADKNRPAIVRCDKETWPEVKKLIKESQIRSKYNHNRITLD
jgi:hypothetical protein